MKKSDHAFLCAVILISPHISVDAAQVVTAIMFSLGLVFEYMEAK
jgi:hypothetical protein